MQRHRPELGLPGGTDSGHVPERYLPVQERKAGEAVRSNVGIDPDKDYLFDPQQRDARIRAVCGCCGHNIYAWEDYFELDVKKDVLVVCQDCFDEIRVVVA